MKLIRVFGITGTNGKTTASWMLRNILQQKEPCALVGTIEYIIKNAHYTPVNTTPGRVKLRELFSEMKKEGVGTCVMEVSSHGIDQGRVEDVEFTGLGFTNLSRDHLDYHGTMENYYRTKKSLFERSDADKIIFTDDVYGKRLYEELKRGESGDVQNSVISCSLIMQDADFYGKIIDNDFSGTEMELYSSGIFVDRIKVPIPGRHFSEDALLAYAMAIRAGAAVTDIRKGIESLGSVAGRMEIIGSNDDVMGIVDYAHTPDSLEKLLRTVSEMKRGKLFCVFGCGGARDRGKRSEMGRVAGKYSDYCIITSDNPRGEPPENIAQAIELGIHPTGCGYEIILDREQAVKRAVSLADKWDIIVVAGKGHEAYQITGSECVPFDDRKVLKELLEKKHERIYNGSDRDRNGRTSDFGK